MHPLILYCTVMTKEVLGFSWNVLSFLLYAFSIITNVLPPTLWVSQDTSTNDQTNSFHRYACGSLYSHQDSSLLPSTTIRTACWVSCTRVPFRCSFSPFAIYISLNVLRILTISWSYLALFLWSYSWGLLLFPFPLRFSFLLPLLVCLDHLKSILLEKSNHIFSSAHRRSSFLPRVSSRICSHHAA